MKIHENYSSLLEVNWNDIGLIRVSKPILFNDRVNKVDLQTETFNEDGVSAILTGWGDTGVIYYHKKF